jgi:putative DNA primase/helicase
MKLIEDKSLFSKALQEAPIEPKPVAVSHVDILDKLLEQVAPIDFEVLAFPHVKDLRRQLEQVPTDSEQAKDIRKKLDKIKLNTKHLLVSSVENILELAKENRWSLCKNHDFVYIYNGEFWSELDEQALQKFLGEASERMGVAKFSARHYQFREQLIKQFLCLAYLPTPQVNNETVLINLRNGTFEITSKGTKLRPFDSTDFLTYQLPFEYDLSAKAPLFEQYLNRVLPDIERQKILAEYMGYVFIKHGSRTLKEEKALILHGSGANGKSVFSELVNALLGAENVSSYSLQNLTETQGYQRAKLANKLVNYASEINGKLETSIFKQLVSGEPVEARLPYGQPFIMNQYAKLIFNCNELPKEVEHTHAYFRRFLIIPFDVTIPPEEQDKQLHIKIIENELSGVFNWVLQGLHRLLQQKKFSECEAVKIALEQYKLESDSVQMFLNESDYVRSTSSSTPLKDLHKKYREFCMESGFRECSIQTFSSRLKNAGYVLERKKSGQVVYVENSFITELRTSH